MKAGSYIQKKPIVVGGSGFPALLFSFFILLTQCTSETDPSHELAILESGVSLVLAKKRAQLLSDVAYEFSFSLPEKQDSPITASVTVTFALRSNGEDLALDFRQSVQHVLAMTINERKVPINLQNDHLLLSANDIRPGTNTVMIDFVAGDMSLNRSADYLYTLLVPDRASTVFPCFDQPNIKARYTLQLDMPIDWEASANGALDTSWIEDNRKFERYQPTRPFSTYVFGFAAGKFKVRTAMMGEQQMRMLFRETDTAKVAANASAIFETHQEAVQWMEAYTGIGMPFGKIDFVLIPGFQYGGMEHIGNIFYRESSLMLEPDASETQKLSRARLIAHETAHMWFGNLVTMDWFDDVWLKEVFANFMAAKMVNPSFPHINHDLNFLWSHLPSAYSEDRSMGSHPIQQELDNLKNAGTLYGRIIYQKAPVVMRQLEARVGEEAFRSGLADYLKQFAYDNATWDNLIDILDQKTAEDLKSWSKAWVKRAGMPIYQVEKVTSKGSLKKLIIVARNRTEDGLFWDQRTTMALIHTANGYRKQDIDIAGKKTVIDFPEDTPQPRVILPNASPMSYGFFDLSETDYHNLADLLPQIPDPLIRATAYWTLYEAVVRRSFPASKAFGVFLENLSYDEDPLNQERLLAYTENLFWQYLVPAERQALAQSAAKTLRELLMAGDLQPVQAALWNTYRNTAFTVEHREHLYQIWMGKESIPFLNLTENRRISLAASLAIYFPERARQILETEEGQINNPDQKDRFLFLKPALSPDLKERLVFFESLKDPANRAKEPWVSAGLQYLHHPLRAETALELIVPALEMMPEIQATGDIFFPRQWANATLGGHQSKEAAQLVHTFMKQHEDMSYRLRNKIWMAADPLLRAAGLVE